MLLRKTDGNLENQQMVSTRSNSFFYNSIGVVLDDEIFKIRTWNIFYLYL